MFTLGITSGITLGTMGTTSGVGGAGEGGGSCFGIDGKGAFGSI